jgi:hypothetical protein
MQTLTINNYKVTVFETNNGDQVFIENSQGQQIYDARVHKGDAIERAILVIGRQ